MFQPRKRKVLLFSEKPCQLQLCDVPATKTESPAIFRKETITVRAIINISEKARLFFSKQTLHSTLLSLQLQLHVVQASG